MDFAARLPALFCALCVFAAAAPTAPQAAERYEPEPGQPGKDVVWVPTPDALIEHMLDMAQIAPGDFVIDLGSGDGRAVIAAARRGVPALGVEYNDKLVELARERAAQAGVADKARFEQGDMFEADISQASVLALFLLPHNLDQLAPKFLAMQPGSRIVLNTYVVSGWAPDRSERLATCEVWCWAHLYVVPASAEGEWKLGRGTLTLRQIFQEVRGTLTQGREVLEIEDGRLRGDRIGFTAGGTRYEGRVEGDRMTGERSGKDGGRWTASRTQPAKRPKPE